jgi:uncharacterized repeat protein (TIGR03837 family)
MRLDIFCTVIDNYGDIGIAWRLSKQLVAEYGLSVCLWVDDLTSFKHIRPEIDPERDSQSLNGVRIRLWSSPLPADAIPADIVIEAFACELPETYILAMATRVPKPVWINLEYLSAEDWITACHGLPSPHPRLPLVKYFFFPGWRAGTGGILREQCLTRVMNEFHAGPDAPRKLWARLGLPEAVPTERSHAAETRISMFAYENAAIPELLEAWSNHPEPIRCLVPEGRPVSKVAAYFGTTGARPGDRFQRGQLSVDILPMLDQDSYDQLLWSCDLNFVRGEDSFVRACWAGQPLVWQAYRQEEDAHWPKIDAFLRIYCQELDSTAASALQTMWRAWNRESGAAQAWPAFWAQRQELTVHQRGWIERISHLGDLADNLVHFCQEKL